MKSLIALTLSAALLSGCIGMTPPRDGGSLKIASWNMEHLAERDGEGCSPRTGADYARLRAHASALGADVIAFQEVQNRAAAERVFDPALYDVVMSGRPASTRSGECRGRPGLYIQNQAVGFAIRKGVPWTRNPDLSALALGNPDLRWGVDVTVSRGRPVRLLAVHLKSGCNSGRELTDPDCPVLFDQLPVLEGWTEARAREGTAFVVLGDWNRRLASRNDAFLADLNDGDPEGSTLNLTSGDRSAGCKARYREYIDFIATGVAATARIEPGSFEEYVYGGVPESEPDDAMHQGLDDDEEELLAAVDFFAPLTPEADQHPSFKVLLNDPRYSPAREMIAAMMRYHVDVDGNFIQQFQTVAFDTRLWELYLFAVFTELGFARMGEHAAPDFVMTSLRGGMGVEATTANPPDDGEAPRPKTRDEALAYMENYVPIKLARALKKKLKKKTPYWEQPGMEGLPFAIALQDFHAPGSMTTVARTATEYVFGVRHSMRGQTRHIEWIETHAYGTSSEPSGFFKLKDADHVSAVLVNPQGTLVKFNRLGLMAGFGDPRVRMVRSGIRRHDGDADPRPRPFTDEVHAAGYEESWVEGLVVLHNPGAQRPLDPDLLPGATHEYLEPDGRIMSALPDSPPPYFARTAVFLDGQTVEEPDVQND